MEESDAEPEQGSPLKPPRPSCKPYASKSKEKFEPEDEYKQSSQEESESEEESESGEESEEASEEEVPKKKVAKKAHSPRLIVVVSSLLRYEMSACCVPAGRRSA